MPSVKCDIDCACGCGVISLFFLFKKLFVWTTLNWGVDILSLLLGRVLLTLFGNLNGFYFTC